MDKMSNRYPHHCPPGNHTLPKRQTLPVLKRFLAILAVLVSNPSMFGGEIATVRTGISRIDETDLRRHLNALASDALEGRQAGTRGGKAAIAYLRTELKAMRQSPSRMRELPLEQIQEFGQEYQNLILYLPGSDEALKHETIIVGAHYDHVGYGNASNSRGPLGQVHNGADDNASGTSAILELIDAFSSLETAPPRSILFAFWDGEEIGLLGSRHWVSNPTVPLQQVRFVLNLDMLGRLRDGRVMTWGWRSAPGLRTMLAEQNVSNDLSLMFQTRVLADSDHYHFYAREIPILALDTDKHDDYHRPTDDSDKIRFDGLRQMTEFAYRILVETATRPQLPGFRRQAFSEMPPAWMAYRGTVESRIRWNVRWNEEFAKKDVIELTHADFDSNATSGNAALRAGDRITRVGPWENGTLADLKTTLQIVKNPVRIRFERRGVPTPTEIDVTFGGSPIRLGGGWVEDHAMPNCVIMTHVIKDSPADRAGLAAGDVLLELAGREITSSDHLKSRITNESGPLVFRIERQGRIRDVTVDLFDTPRAKPQ